MPRTVLHCLRGSEDRKDIINNATSHGLKANIKYVKNPYAFEIVSDESDTIKHNNFIEQYEKDPNITIFYDIKHAKCQKNMFKSHIRIKTTQLKISPSVGPADTTAQNLAAYYNYPPYVPTVNSTRPLIGIISLGGNFKKTDLNHYWTITQTPPSPVVLPNVTVVHVDNNIPPAFGTDSDADIENTLDLEVVGGICYNANINFYTAANTAQHYYNAFNQALSDNVNAISTSWGAQEEIYESTIPSLTAYNQLYQLCITNGITISCSSGDNGSSDGDNSTSTSTNPYTYPIPHVDFPAASTSVIACGGTSLVGANETAWSAELNDSEWIGGGGGKSRYIVRPSYQVNNPTSPYLVTEASPFGRGLPDIALNADPESPWHIYYNSNDYYVGGTSAVAPAVTALIGIMNVLASIGTPPRLGYVPLGFNTYLYNIITTMPTSFNDITMGNNNTVLTGPYGMPGSGNYYVTEVGYDYTTGIGSFEWAKSVNCANYYNISLYTNPIHK